MFDISVVDQSACPDPTTSHEPAPPPVDHRLRRVDAVLAQYAAGHTTAGAAPVTELLRDLRHWCDNQALEFGTLLDASFVAYMLGKFGSLAQEDRRCA
jgi:hypothetical protein